MMHLQILTPEKQVYSGEVSGVKVPGEAGSFEMLNNHAPIISSLGKGEVKIKELKGSELRYKISGGFVECLNNDVKLLVESIEEA